MDPFPEKSPVLRIAPKAFSRFTQALASQYFVFIKIALKTGKRDREEEAKLQAADGKILCPPG